MTQAVFVKPQLASEISYFLTEREEIKRCKRQGMKEQKTDNRVHRLAVSCN